MADQSLCRVFVFFERPDFCGGGLLNQSLPSDGGSADQSLAFDDSSSVSVDVFDVCDVDVFDVCDVDVCDVDVFDVDVCVEITVLLPGRCSVLLP